jgi:predicted nucleic acid-binding protein
MILIDTSALIGSLAGQRTHASLLRGFIADGIRLGVSSIVLYEWWRGPRTEMELKDQQLLFPREAAFGFGVREAAVAAELYRRLKRPRGREVDIAIAACAIVQGADLWTLNPPDFSDVPGLTLAGT